MKNVRKLALSISTALIASFACTAAFGAPPSGWPNHLAMGAVTNGQAGQMIGVNVEAVFMYSSGKGSNGIVFPSAAGSLVQVATEAKAKPVLVIYTVNGSEDAIKSDFASADTIGMHMVNLAYDCIALAVAGTTSPSIIINPDFLGQLQKNLQIANVATLSNTTATQYLSTTNTSIPVNAAIAKAVNFLGAGVDWSLGIKDSTQRFTVHATPVELVTGVLQKKWKYKESQTQIDSSTGKETTYSWDADIAEWNTKDSFEAKAQEQFRASTATSTSSGLPQFSDDLSGYIQAIHYLIETYAPPGTTYGWQSNIWASSTGSGNWVHLNPTEADISGYSDTYYNFWKSLRVVDGAYKPDFIVFDKYERNSLSRIEKGEDPFRSGWLWNQSEIQKYLRFVSLFSNKIGLPAMLWQIPGGHLKKIDGEKSMTDLALVKKTGTMSTEAPYIFGETDFGIPEFIGNSVLSAAYGKDLVDTKVSAHLGEDALWHSNHLKSVVDANVFAILWGGGNTTSVGDYPGSDVNDKGWLRQKVNAYYAKPVSLP